LDCSWTGSEAGIAAISGQTLTQNVNGGTYALPGVPPSFLTQASSWQTSATLGTGVNPDVRMADTSQAVSLTPTSVYAAKDYGVMGIIPFTWMKGYNSSPDSSWTDLSNVTIPQLFYALGGKQLASFFTGKPADTDSTIVVGRNEGSGTRVNTILNLNYGIANTVDQYAINSSYPGSTPGVLTQNGIVTAANFGTPLEVGNDGFDGGSGVQKCLNCDSAGSGYVVIGYLGLSDGLNANVNANGKNSNQPATFLSLDGVFENNGTVESGQYSFWGHEHLLGQKNVGATTTAGYTAADLKAGVLADEVAHSYGATASSQDFVIQASLMNATKTSDTGYPVDNE
jgi:hypothetical protein